MPKLSVLLLAGLLPLVGVGLVGCGSDKDGQGVRTAPANTVAVRACDAPSGSLTDVATEPGAVRGAASGRDWTTKDGCLIRIDALADYDGADHCGYGSARFIVLRANRAYLLAKDKAVGAQDFDRYVRDPEQVYGNAQATNDLSLNASLPARAVDAGFRHGDEEIWEVPGDNAAIYVKTGGQVERWPRFNNIPQCS